MTVKTEFTPNAVPIASISVKMIENILEKFLFLHSFIGCIVIAVASIALINLILKTNSRTKFYRLFTLLQI